MEGNPRKVFISMFGQGQTKEERQAILGTTTSLLDYVTEATASLNRKLDAADRAKVGSYLDSVREVEQRVQKLTESSESLADLPDAPIGAPDDFGELLAVQFELFALAWETNRTNVVTMKMVEEASMRTYPHLGVHEAFHPTSHWGGFPERIANLRLIQNYHTAVFAKFAQRLGATRRTATARCSTIRSSCSAATWRNSDAHNDDPLPQASDRARRRREAATSTCTTSRTRRTRTFSSRCSIAPACLPKSSRSSATAPGPSPKSEADASMRLTFRTAAIVALPAIVIAVGRVGVLMLGAGVGAPRMPTSTQRNADGSTPLQWAVYDGDVAEVRRLLDAGADVSLANDYGATPMSLAAEVADTEILKLLLEAGADADSPNADGRRR